MRYTKGRFAVTAMIDVGLRENPRPVFSWPRSRHATRSRCRIWSSCSANCASAALSKAPGAPVAATLWRARAETITVADIIGAVEGDRRDDETQGSAMPDTDGAAAMTAELWATLNARMIAHLQSITLNMLVSEQRAQGVKIDRKAAPRQGVYKQPAPEPVRTTVPNSVFALGGMLLARR